MELKTTEQLVIMELNKNGLEDWVFEWNNAKTINGQCYYLKKIIKLSKNYVIDNPFELVYNTILHEIAHALAYQKYNATGHCRTWRNIFINLGGTGSRCSNRVKKAEPKHVYTCQNCKHEIGTYRKLKDVSKMYHKECSISGRLTKTK